MAMPAVTDPPGLLMYIQMSLPGSSASRKSSCAQTLVGHVVADVGAEHHDAALEQAVEDVRLEVGGGRLEGDRDDDL